MSETNGAARAGEEALLPGAKTGARQVPGGWPVLALIIAAALIYSVSAVVGGAVALALFWTMQSYGFVPATVSFADFLLLPGSAAGPMAPAHFAAVGTLFLFNALAMVALTLFIAKRSLAGGRAAAVPLRRVRSPAVIGAVIVVPVVALAAFVVAYRLTGEAIPAEIGFQPGDWRMWVYPLGVVVAAPIAEEIAFRGWLFAGITRRTGSAKTAIWVTAILWALLHVSQGWAKVAALVPTGLLLGAMRHKTGSLWPTLAGHISLNAMGFTYMVWLAGE